MGRGFKSLYSHHYFPFSFHLSLCAVRPSFEGGGLRPGDLKKSFEIGLATYFSRSRNELWTKGLTSGNTQELITALFDCDQDALLFKVKQKGNACHLERFSCFEDKEFCINDLYELLLSRKNIVIKFFLINFIFDIILSIS